MRTETGTNPLLAEGRGVVIRDTQGIGEPIPGRVVEVGRKYALVDVHAADGEPVRFEVSTLCAMLPGEHDRWKLTAPGGPGSEEYGDLLIRQARLQAERERISRELDLIAAVLESADEETAPESLADVFADVHRLAGQVAGRIGDDEVAERLRGVKASAEITRTENER